MCINVFGIIWTLMHCSYTVISKRMNAGEQEHIYWCSNRSLLLFFYYKKYKLMYCCRLYYPTQYKVVQPGPKKKHKNAAYINITNQHTKMIYETWVHLTTSVLFLLYLTCSRCGSATLSPIFTTLNQSLYVICWLCNKLIIYLYAHYIWVTTY